MFGRKTGGVHAYIALARKRLDEMDKSLTALEQKARKEPVRAEAKKILADLKRYRAGVEKAARQMKSQASAAEARMKKLSAASAVSWVAFGLALAKSRKEFAYANRKAGKAIKRAVR